MPEAPLPQALAHAETLLRTRPDLALRQATAILVAVPDHPVAQLIQGSAQRLTGDTRAAAVTLRPLAHSQPNAAHVQYEWALVQAALGDPAGARASLRRAVQLAPDLAQAWRALGDLHTLAGERAAAEAAYARHIQASVHDPALMQAAHALCADDLPTSEALLRTHLRTHPTDVAALRMLAELGTRLGRYEDAEALLEHCLELLPGFAPARHNYALVLFRQNKSEAALAQIRRLLADEPGNVVVRNLLAACLASLGDYAGSIATYEEVLRAAPAQPKIWLSYGHALKTAGQRAPAVAAYRKCLALAPGFGEAWWSLANLKTEPFGPADQAAMRAQLAAPGLSAEDRFHLHYALGRAQEQANEPADAFAHYAQGASLRRAQIDYSADRTTAQLDRARALLTAEFFATRQGWGCQDGAPIFVVGLPRSGSTLIEQILASHSAVEGTMELPEMAKLARGLGSGGGEDTYPARLAELDAPACLALGEAFLARTRIHRKLGRPYFIDKMPNNFVHVGLIQLILPRARIIDARRAPMATCFSAFKQHFAKGQHFSYDLAELGRYWRDYAALMDHYDCVLPGRVHRVQHERMVQETEAEIRRLLAYCGLGYEPACLAFHLNARPVRTASSEQVRQPIFTEGLDHWRAYRPYLQTLEAALNP